GCIRCCSPRFIGAASRRAIAAASCPGRSRTTTTSTPASKLPARAVTRPIGCMTNRSVSITGATGFIGWHAAEAFREAGGRAPGIVRPGSPKALPPGVERAESLLEAGSLARVVNGSSVIVHAAGVVRAGRPQTFDIVNVGGTRAAVGAANDAGARLI